MKFCSQCASPISIKIPADDSRERHVCDSCGVIHYFNPRNVVGSIPVYRDQILLCRRAIEPRHGFWTLPAGFMELGESTTTGAARETQEEAGAIVAAVVAGLGGENANAAIVTELMTEVVSAFEGNPVIAESIVLAVINIAPNLVASIEASQGGFSGNPLNSLIPDGAIINTGDQQVTVNPPPPAS